MSPWIPFNLLPADTLPEWILVALAGLDLLLKIVALGWIPHRRRPSVALAWLLAIFLVPYAGIVLFLVLGSARLPRKRMEQQARMNHVIQENTPPGVAVDRELERYPQWVRTTAELNQNLGALPMVGGNDFEILPDNHENMARMAADVDAATDYVHFEFYIVAVDQVSRDLLNALIRAHERGVRVRILIDHVGSLGYPGTPSWSRSSTAAVCRGAACCPSARGAGSGSARTCATTARSWWWTAGWPTRARRTSSTARTTSGRTSGRAGSGVTS